MKCSFTYALPVQPNGSSCALLVVAIAVHIAYQVNLEISIYNIRELYSHMLDSFNKNSMIYFPKKLTHGFVSEEIFNKAILMLF